MVGVGNVAIVMLKSDFVLAPVALELLQCVIELGFIYINIVLRSSPNI